MMGIGTPSSRSRMPRPMVSSSNTDGRLGTSARSQSSDPQRQTLGAHAAIRQTIAGPGQMANVGLPDWRIDAGNAMTRSTRAGLR